MPEISFSVIIPLYNKEKYIAKAILSVLKQTFINFELIVVNDGSTDNSVQLVEDLVQSTTIPVNIINQPNQGVSAARNTGIQNAKYDYVSFLDADDWWSPSFLQEMNNLIVDYPDAGIYGSAYNWVKYGKNTTTKNTLTPGYRGYINYLEIYISYWWMPLTSISVVVPKNILNEFGGFKNTLKFGEDFDLWIRIILKYKTAYVNSPLAFYNQDVEANNRSIGSGKIYPPSTFTTFNWDYLYSEENTNKKLKILLDGLRVRSLLRYYLNNQYLQETKQELAKVNFNLQPPFYRRIYTYPKLLVSLYFTWKNLGSRIKKIIKKHDS